jgi:hypothetical protein
MSVKSVSRRPQVQTLKRELASMYMSDFEKIDDFALKITTIMKLSARKWRRSVLMLTNSYFYASTIHEKGPKR